MSAAGRKTADPVQEKVAFVSVWVVWTLIATFLARLLVSFLLHGRPAGPWTFMAAFALWGVMMGVAQTAATRAFGLTLLSRRWVFLCGLGACMFGAAQSAIQGAESLGLFACGGAIFGLAQVWSCPIASRMRWWIASTLCWMGGTFAGGAVALAWSGSRDSVWVCVNTAVSWDYWYAHQIAGLHAYDFQYCLAMLLRPGFLWLTVATVGVMSAVQAVLIAPVVKPREVDVVGRQRALGGTR